VDKERGRRRRLPLRTSISLTPFSLGAFLVSNSLIFPRSISIPLLAALPQRSALQRITPLTHHAHLPPPSLPTGGPLLSSSSQQHPSRDCHGRKDSPCGGWRREELLQTISVEKEGGTLAQPLGLEACVRNLRRESIASFFHHVICPQSRNHLPVLIKVTQVLLLASARSSFLFCLCPPCFEWRNHSRSQAVLTLLPSSVPLAFLTNARVPSPTGRDALLSLPSHRHRLSSRFLVPTGAVC
jgi:hypothetical protein